MEPSATERRLAVIDLGSNSFRLVVFSWVPGGWWKRTDEIYESVRLGAGLDAAGALQEAPMERALQTVELYAHFCRASGIGDIRAVATSAIRDATNQAEFLERACDRSGLEVRVLSVEEEALFGYLAVVNTTTLTDGVTLDLGGGSMQLVRVASRMARERESWPLGAVRMTERFLPGKRASKKEIRAMRAHVRDELARAPWLAGAARNGRRLAGVGGTVRNLASAAEIAAGLPSYGVQGFVIGREALDDLVSRLAGLPAGERATVPGVKPERADLILAGALVIQGVVEATGAEGLEVTEAGLREGVFLDEFLGPADPPLFEDVRRAGVLNLAGQYHTDFTHADHVAALALQIWDALAAAGVHGGDRGERDLVWAAAMLHDIGVTVDYDDHHKHSRYIILNAGLAGHTPREKALIGQITRYHRKGDPGLGEFAPLARKGDEALLRRCAAVLRLAEQLERSRDQIVRAARVEVADGTVVLRLETGGDVSVARWAAQRQTGLFEDAFGRALLVEG